MDKTIFDSQLRQLLTQAADAVPARFPSALPDLSQFPGIPGWHQHELALWNIGEQIRQLLAESGKWMDDAQVDAVLQICLNSSAGRGRQSFVLLLGKVRYARFAPSVALLLQDAEVCGQAVNTLYKMKADGYAHLIQPLSEHELAWIRREAKRYLQKYDS